MALPWKSALKLAGVFLAASTTATRIDETLFSPADTIVRDVVVLGGGASGSYAAVRLKDFGKTVVVVEKKDHLVRLPHAVTVVPNNHRADSVALRADMLIPTLTRVPGYPLTSV